MICAPGASGTGTAKRRFKGMGRYLQYENFAGTSGVAAFEIGDRSIKVRFVEGGTYLYDQTRPGKVHVAQMISLARAGAGLATYINQQVRGNYARKLD